MDVSSSTSCEYHTPAGDQLTSALKDVFELARSRLHCCFRVISRDEMRGHSGNELAELSDANYQAIWQALMLRLGTFPTYRRYFEAAYPGTRFEDMNFAHASPTRSPVT